MEIAKDIWLVFTTIWKVNAFAAVLAVVLGGGVAKAYHWAWWSPFAVAVFVVILLTLLVWVILKCFAPSPQ